MLLSDFINRAITVPFMDRGRDFDGWDCWGLVLNAYWHVYGINLPDQLTEYSNTRQIRKISRLLQAGAASEQWVQVPESDAEAMDVVFMALRGLPCHVGLVITKGCMLHTEVDRGCVIEKWGRAPWRGRDFDHIIGFYRHATYAV